MWQQKYSRVRLDLIQIWFSFDIKALKVEKLRAKGNIRAKLQGGPEMKTAGQKIKCELL